MVCFRLGASSLLAVGPAPVSGDGAADFCLFDGPSSGAVSAARFFDFPNRARRPLSACIGNRFSLLTVLPRLHITNLQVVSLDFSDLTTAAKEQLILYPEYLLPVLWPKQENYPRHPLLRLAFLAIWFDIGIHGVLELFYGAAMPLRTDPLHAAARCGALSVFNRLESLQLILWTMAITVKLALYLYAICTLLSNKEKSAASVKLQSFPLYFAGIWLLCVLLQRQIFRRQCSFAMHLPGDLWYWREWEVLQHGFAKIKSFS